MIKDYENLSDSSLYEKSSNIKLSQADDTINKIKYNIYEPTTDDQICCIELVNNNKIQIRYEEGWKIKDLIKAVIMHKEFRKLYPNRKWTLLSKNYLPLFDLHLILYRSIKKETETKIDFEVQLQDLRDLGLLKSSKYPFFVFKDNCNRNNLIINDINERSREIYNTLLDNSLELNTLYLNYLPRANPLWALITSPDLEAYYQNNKKGVNQLNNFKLDPLISENENLDWFIYDDESLNFLMDMEKISLNVQEKIDYDDDNINKIYFQDKYNYIGLSTREHKSFYIVLILDSMSMKIESSLVATPLELLNRINQKLEKIKPEMCFNPRKKILKVNSMNDYILDLDEPIGKFAHVNECIKTSRIPEYRVVDNPLVEDRNKIIKGNSIHRWHKMRSINSIRNGGTEEYTRIGMFSSTKVCNPSYQMAIPFRTAERNSLRLTDDFGDENRIQSGSKFSFEKIKQKFEKKFVKEEEDNNTLKKIFQIANFIPNDTPTPSGGKNRISMPSETKVNQKADALGEYLSQIQEAMTKKFQDRADNIKEVEEEDDKEDPTAEHNSIIINNRNRSRGIGIRITSHDVEKTDGVKLVKIDTNKTLPNINDKIPIEKYIEEKTQPIDISDISRPFSIILRQIQLDKLYNSASDEKKDFISIIVIKVQMFCGLQAFSKPRQIKWTSYTPDKNPLFNKRIYFDVNYNTLQMFTSILFKVKHVTLNKQNEKIKQTVIGWNNFRLFDHNRRLKTDDSYFCYIDSPNKSTNIYFELETFMLPVIHVPTEVPKNIFNNHSYMISESDQSKIYEILEKTPFDELNNYDKEILWNNRYALTQIPSILPKLLTCIDYKNPIHLKELEKILKLSKCLTPVQALQLLTGNFLHESIRKFAVQCLNQANHVEVKDYIIQLVQAIKYEMYHDSHLARYLLKLAVRYPLTLGHYLFWSFRSEMYNPIVQQRFGLYMEVFLNKIGYNLRTIFEDENWLIKSLLNVAEIPHDKKLKTNEEKLAVFRERLKTLNNEMNNREVSLPLNFKMRVNQFVVEKCRFMKSKKRPLWLVFRNADKTGENIVVMFKKGDDLRQDIITLQLFKIMQSLWFEEKINLKMSLYNVICTGYYQGMLEIVKESETLATIHKLYGGATASFSSKPLRKWLEKNAVLGESEYVQNFISSCAAYCVATFVLGVGDRHNDNIMVKKNGELFHIDFGHFLGHFKYKYGFKRERAPFVFTKEFRKVMGGKKSEDFAEFRRICFECYQVLRKNSEVLVTLLRMVLCSSIPELTEKSIRFLETSLSLNSDKKKSEDYIKEKLNESLNSLSTKFNFAIHIFANK